MVLGGSGGSSCQNIHIILELFNAPFLVLIFFLLYINDFPDVICNIAIHADDNTLYCKCDKASDL